MVGRSFLEEGDQMKFLHTADWHIGKKLNGYSLLNEQADAFRQVLAIAEREQVDAIVVAGDLYDRSVPSVEAIELFNQMMIEMNLEKKYPLLAISGNHDSSTRLETGGPWYAQLNFHLHTRLEQAFQPVVLGNTQFFLLPYFEPFQARAYFEDDTIRTIEEAMVSVVKEMKTAFDPTKKQVLVAHFFVAGGEKSESETQITVGGLDAVPRSLLGDFAYVALGHLHYKNALTKGNARYSGALLNYSLEERAQEKGVWIVQVSDTKTTVDFQKIIPLRDVVLLEETFATLTDPEFYNQVNRENYIGIILKDRGVIPNVMQHLRQIYPFIIRLERQARKTNPQTKTIKAQRLQQQNPEELFTQYFKETTGEELSAVQAAYLKTSLTMIEKSEKE